MKRIFLYSQQVRCVCEDSGFYSLRPLKSKKGETRYNYYWEPRGDDCNPLVVKSALDRGKRFFERRDGMMPGVIYDLRQQGNIIKEEV